MSESDALSLRKKPRFEISITHRRETVHAIYKNVYDARYGCKMVFLLSAAISEARCTLLYDRHFPRYLFLAQSFFFRVGSSFFCPSKSEGLFSRERLETHLDPL